MQPSPFKSFFQGGFECSTHRRKDGKRLDVIAATAHDLNAEADYRLLNSIGIQTVRDGFRWHLIEHTPGIYDWASFLPMLRAAKITKTQVIWDLCHYGWPDDLDIWSSEFINRFAAFAGAAAKIVREETSEVPFYVPINEISFMAWAGGQFSIFNPYGKGRGHELKVQLVRAAIAAMEAIWNIEPRARMLHIEPAINVLPDTDNPASLPLATSYNAAQFEAWDMLSGRTHPQLGGLPRYLDIIGINYYCHNQWTVTGGPLEFTDEKGRKFSEMLAENYQRYNRPIFIAETGIEGELRPKWLSFVCNEVRNALALEVPIHGICLYPVLNHPGWDDDRHCPNGIIDYALDTFQRTLEVDLLKELQTQQGLMRDRQSD